MSSPFAVTLTSLLHSGDFAAAAETIERALLDAGRVAGEAALPSAAAAIVDVPARALENAIVDGTGKLLQGEPVGPVLRAEAVGIEDRLSQAIAQNLGSVLPGLVAAAVVPLLKEITGKIEEATANAGK